MSLNTEPMKQDNALLHMIDEGIAALETDTEFSLTIDAIKEFSERNEKEKVAPPK